MRLAHLKFEATLICRCEVLHHGKPLKCSASAPPVPVCHTVHTRAAGVLRVLRVTPVSDTHSPNRCVLTGHNVSEHPHGFHGGDLLLLRPALARLLMGTPCPGCIFSGDCEVDGERSSLKPCGERPSVETIEAESDTSDIRAFLEKTDPSMRIQRETRW